MGMTDEGLIKLLEVQHELYITSLGREPRKYSSTYSLAADRIEQLRKQNEELESELEDVYEGMGGV